MWSRRKKDLSTAGKVGMIIVVGAMILSGCNKNRPVDYDIDESALTEQIEESSALEKLSDAGKWEEEWKGTMENGDEMTFHVNTEITVPAADSMAVVEVKSPETEAGYNEKVVKAVFGEEDVYYYDNARLPKAVLQERILAYEATIAENQTLIEEQPMEGALLAYTQATIEEDKEKLTACQEALKTAGNDYIPVKDYDSEAYRGMINGIAYILRIEWSMADAMDGIRWRTEEGKSIAVTVIGDDTILNEQKVMNILFLPEDLYEVCPEEVREAEGLTYESGYDETNQCRMSEAEAESIAERTLVDSGFSNPVCKNVSALVWEGDQEELGDGSAIYNTCRTDGYILRYEFGMDELSFLDFGVEGGYTDYDKSSDFYSLTAWAEVCVAEQGVIAIDVNNPVEVTAITKDVQLLPLENIQKIICDELTNNPEQFIFVPQTYCSFNSMELIYFRIRDNKQNGYYSYIPAWRLCNKKDSGFYESAVVVNAIDGSVINISDEFSE